MIASVTEMNTEMKRMMFGAGIIVFQGSWHVAWDIVGKNTDDEDDDDDMKYLIK